MTSGAERNQFLCMFSRCRPRSPVAQRWSISNVAAFGPSQLLQGLLKRRDACPRIRIVHAGDRGADQHADAADRARCARATSGIAAAPPRAAMNSRRRIGSGYRV